MTGIQYKRSKLALKPEPSVLIVKDSPQTAQYFLRQVTVTIALLLDKVEGLPSEMKGQLRHVHDQLNKVAEPLEARVKAEAAARRAEKKAIERLLS